MIAACWMSVAAQSASGARQWWHNALLTQSSSMHAGAPLIQSHFIALWKHLRLNTNVYLVLLVKRVVIDCECKICSFDQLNPILLQFSYNQGFFCGMLNNWNLHQSVLKKCNLQFEGIYTIFHLNLWLLLQRDIVSRSLSLCFSVIHQTTCVYQRSAFLFVQHQEKMMIFHVYLIAFFPPSTSLH